MNTIAFFNDKGGVGKTTLVYHVAWTLADMGLQVLAADLDPQANLSSMFLSEERLAELWPDGDHEDSILGAVTPILRGTGDIAAPRVEEVADGLGLLVGDLGLSRFEDKLSLNWPRCSDGHEDAFRVISAFQPQHKGVGRTSCGSPRPYPAPSASNSPPAKTRPHYHDVAKSHRSRHALDAIDEAASGVGKFAAGEGQ